MTYVKLLMTGAVLSLQIGMIQAADIALTEGYLTGRWSLEGKEACDSETVAYVLFRDNGIAEYGHGKHASIVGFWKIRDGSLVSHTLVQPSERKEYHPFLQRSYRYEYMAPEVKKIEQDMLTLQMGAANQEEIYVLSRCP